MKLLFPLALALAWFGAGCEHVDIAPAGSPDRVLTGSVRAPAALPAGAEIIVRVIDASPSLAPAPVKNDLPIADRARPFPVERPPLGEFRQVLSAPTIDPIPFRIEYRAEDAELRRGLHVDVRVSFEGRVRYRTISAHVVTLASSPYPQEVPVQGVE